jgi:hypothetical protein
MRSANRNPEYGSGSAFTVFGMLDPDPDPGVKIAL